MTADAYDPRACATALQRLYWAPLDLVDADFVQLATFDSALASKAYEVRSAAQRALASPVKKKSAEPSPPLSKHERFAEKLATLVIDTFAPLLKSYQAKNASLERRLAALEARPPLKYAGTWKSGTSYQECQLVTHQGGLWLSIETTKGTPGTVASGWRLIVKSGRA